MKRARDEEPRLAEAEAAFVASVKAEFTPEPLTPARRAAFDVALAQRIGRRRRLGLPLLTAAAAAAAAGWLLVVGWNGLGPAPVAGPAPLPRLAEADATLRWEDEVFDGLSFGGEAATGELESLPDEYAAIADAFLDG